MLASLIAAATAFAPLLRYGSSDLSPVVPLPLGGYTARNGRACELPGDRLEARALLIDRPNGRIAVVSVDLLTIPESLYREVAAQIGEHTDLFLVATHTHCAPDSQMLNERMDFAIPGIAKYRAEQLAAFAGRIAASVRRAATSQPIKSGAGRIEFARLPLNRGRREFAKADTLAIRLRDAQGDLALTHYAAHAVLYGPAENHPRTDFPGFIRGPKGLFLPGAIGDMSPASTGATPADQVANFAKRFEAGPWRVETWSASPVRFLQTPIALDPIQPNPEFARLNKIPEVLAQTIVRKFAPSSGFLTSIRLGKLAIVGVPGEPTAELGRRIRSIGMGLGFQAVLTVSHVNGWIGYILAADDYGRGGYEASLGFHGSGTGDRIVEAARTALRDLASG